MDVLIFWVTLGFLVEATRAAIQKCCAEKRKKDVNPLREPLLNPEEVLDELRNCRLACCSHRWEEEHFQEEYEEYFLETSEEESLDSLDKLTAITDDSEEDLEELGVKIINWEDLSNSVTVTPVGDRRRSLKGKEIVEEHEEEITHSDLPRSDMIHSIVGKESRGKNSAKIYPEDLHPPFTSIQAPGYKSMHTGQSSDDYELRITDQSAWDYNFKGDIKVTTCTGESSKS